MRKRSLVAAVVAAACLVAAAVAAPASSETGGRGSGRVLELTATTADTTRYPALVDVAGDADTAPGQQDVGDYFVLLNTLTGPGTDAGSRSAGVFTVIDPQAGLRSASVTLELPGGQVTLHGFVRPAAAVNTLAVTGGTGRYAGARGQMEFDQKVGAVNTYWLRLRR